MTGSVRRTAQAVPFKIGRTSVAPGRRVSVRLRVSPRYTQGEMFLPAHVVCGRRGGARMFVSAAIHGDEILGIEIIRRLLQRPELASLAGVLIAVPVVNVYGFLNQQRYLPDRRDLNRSFPGSPTGSLAARLAHCFMREVVSRATHGIDLHTGSLQRINLPHIRARLDDAETARLAHAFGAPVILDSTLRDGSLRAVALERGVPTLVYEAGEVLRFDDAAAETGVAGILAVMRALDMLGGTARPTAGRQTVVAQSSTWVRAPASGILSAAASLGARVRTGQRLGVIANPLGERAVPVCASTTGLVIGRPNLPLVHEGDALFHIAKVGRTKG